MIKILNRASALYLICWAFFPFMQVGMVYRIVAILCAALWLISAIASQPKFISENWNFILASVVVVFLMVLWNVFLGLEFFVAFIRALQVIIMLLIALISLYSFKYDEKFTKFLFPIILMAIIVFCITTTHAVITDPYAARIANSEWMEERFEGNEMVGLYGYVYMCVFIAPMLFYLIQRKVRLGKLTDLLVRLSFIAIVVMVACAGYMLAIFCTLGSCLLIWTFAKKNIFKLIIVTIVLVVFFFSYEFIIDTVFSFLMDVFEDNPVYHTKFRDFRMLFLGADFSGETVYGRFKNYSASWSNIVNYPILGCYFYGKSGFGGGHSAILDIFGRYGWGTAVLYLILILVSPHSIAGKQEKWTLLNYVLLFLTLLFGFFDPFFQELSIAIYFVFPFVMRAATKQEEEKLLR